jgi:carbon storage regulator CsrA
MLHLNRKVNEVIEIVDNQSGKKTELVVLEIRGKTVKLGFHNPDMSCTILRKEIRQKKEQHANPNPYYMDRFPHHKKYTPPVIAEPVPDDGLEQYLTDITAPLTTETPTVATEPVAA